MLYEVITKDDPFYEANPMKVREIFSFEKVQPVSEQLPFKLKLEFV